MSEKKHYLIYQITNNVNGKIYIGKHETFNIDDDYFGSGKHLRHAQEKYGLENFTKTILFELQNEEEMNLLEKMVVTEEFCKRDDVYNLNVGGDGGWTYVKSCGAVKGGINAQKKNKETGFRPFKHFWNSLTALEKDQYKKDHPISENFKCNWTGRKHKPETIEKLKGPKPQIAGEKNGRFNTKWCYNLELKMSICVPQLLWWDYIGNGWIAGRKINF